MATAIFQPVAVDVEEVIRHGCPYCNYRYNRPTDSEMSELRICGNCLRGFAVTGKAAEKSVVEYDSGPLPRIPHPRSDKVVWEGLGLSVRPVRRDESDKLLRTIRRVCDKKNTFSEAEVHSLSSLEEAIIGRALDVLTLNECVERCPGPDPMQRYFKLTIVGQHQADFLLSAIN